MKVLILLAVFVACSFATPTARIILPAVHSTTIHTGEIIAPPTVYSGSFNLNYGGARLANPLYYPYGGYGYRNYGYRSYYPYSRYYRF